jgi:hypothetical protein
MVCDLHICLRHVDLAATSRSGERATFVECD